MKLLGSLTQAEAGKVENGQECPGLGDVTGASLHVVMRVHKAYLGMHGCQVHTLLLSVSEEGLAGCVCVGLSTAYHTL